MMTIFSMLFGAGLVLMSDRAPARDGEEGGFARMYYRRLAVLALLGLVHGFAIWYGDILVYYALSGLFLYPLRKLGVPKLLALSAILLCCQLALNRWEGRGVADVRAKADAAEHALAAGRAVTQGEEDARDEWESIEADHDPGGQLVRRARAHRLDHADLQARARPPAHAAARGGRTNGADELSRPSIIGAAVFAGWGLGLFGRWTHAEVLLFTLAIWVAQLTWSSFWLARFRYGPVEWLWRSATYGQWQRMTLNIDKE
jgi:uncharacterized membrane protein YeiB